MEINLDVRYDTPDGLRQWDMHRGTILEETEETITYQAGCARHFYTTYEEYGTNLRVHKKGVKYACTMKPSTKQVIQEPDDYDDGIPIIMFPAAYVILEVSKTPME